MTSFNHNSSSQPIELIAHLPTDAVSLSEENSIEAYVSLKNRSDTTLTLDFSSSQTFDIYLFDEAREIVCQWSADKMFMQALQSISVEAGQSQRFGGLLELQNLDGNSLEPGVYRLKVAITGRVASPEDGSSVPLSAESRLELVV